MKTKTTTIFASGAIATIRGTPSAVAQIESDIKRASANRMIDAEHARGLSRPQAVRKVQRLERLLSA